MLAMPGVSFPFSLGGLSNCTSMTKVCGQTNTEHQENPESSADKPVSFSRDRTYDVQNQVEKYRHLSNPPDGCRPQWSQLYFSC